MRTSGVTEDYQLGLSLLELLQQGTGRSDGSYLDVQVISLVVVSLASCPAILIQLHRITI